MELFKNQQTINKTKRHLKVICAFHLISTMVKITYEITITDEQYLFYSVKKK